MKPLYQFIGFTFIILAVALVVHLQVLYKLHLFPNDVLFFRAYIINTILSISVASLLFKYRFRFTESMGFFFMGGSLLKFVAYFIFFYPVYTQNNIPSKTEFITFFIPYALSLICETVFLSKVLNKVDVNRLKEKK